MGKFKSQPLRDVLGERGYVRGPFGSALVRRELLDKGVPVYEQQHAITGSREFRFFIGEEKLNELSRFRVRPNDLIISCSGTIGKISVIQPDDPAGIISQALLILRPQTDKVLPDFLYYFLSTREGQYAITQASHGSVQVNIAPRAIVELIEVPVPPIAEQRAIVHILGTLDAKLQLNRKLNETLEAIARALFNSWFIDFDPVRAKMEDRDPGLPKYLADLFPDSFENSKLGLIPKGWGCGCVDDEFDLIMGQSPPGDTYNEMREGIPFYQGRADFGFRFPQRRVYCTSPTRSAKAADTLISVRAPVGDINMALEGCGIGRGVAAARHKSGSRSYTYQFMRSLEDVFARFEGEGTVFGSISKKDFHAIPCTIAPDRLVQAFERFCSPIDDRIERCEREIAVVAALRDALSPKLISGELRIKHVDRFIEGEVR